MTAKKRKKQFYTSVVVGALLTLSACGGGGDSGQDTTRTAVALELKSWAPWDGVTGSLTSEYDAETKTATLSHDEPNVKIAYSRHTINPNGKYRLQFSDKRGVDRAQLIPADDRQLTMNFAEPAQSWVDVHHAFPVDVEFAPETQYVNVRIIFTGEATVGTFNMIPLGDDGEPLPEEPETDDKPIEDSSPPTF